ncbi:hypothetical protein CVT26_006149 [Gymnopilus dilepis]|uniref:Uncharacterized protein n=1 Tax=Gymnopilus dilepis TaxID=231916 RepID=A0A409WG94_9AGAR|nr:hypothetical protein CVT26_006149 [Gymnopilus dilepis]
MPRNVNIQIKKRDGTIVSHLLDMADNKPWEEQPYQWTTPPQIKDRYCFLGIPASREQLRELDCLDLIVRTRGYHRSAAYVLRKACGYEHLFVVQVEPGTEEEKVLVDPEGDKGLFIVMLWVNHPNHFMHYPKNGHVYKLVEILGKLPGWYRDWYEPQNFSSHKLYNPL